MKARITGIIKYALFLFAGLLLLYLAFRNQDLERLMQDLKKANYLWVALSLFFSFLAYISRAYRWILLIEPLGHRPGLANTTYALCSGYLANLAIPRLGEITRCTALSEVEKIPLHASIGTVIAERVIDLISLLLLTFLIIFIEMDRFGSFFKSEIFMPMQQKLVLLYEQLPAWIWIFAAGSFVALPFLVYIKREQLRQFSLFQKFLNLAGGVIQGLRTVFRLKRKRAFFLHTIIIWGLYFLMTYVCFFSIPATSHLGPVAGLFVLVIGGYGMSAPVQGGIGIYHYIVKKGLVLFGVPVLVNEITGTEHSDGLLYATIIHSSQTLLILVLGIFSIAMLNIEKRKRLSISVN